MKLTDFERDILDKHLFAPKPEYAETQNKRAQRRLFDKGLIEQRCISPAWCSVRKVGYFVTPAGKAALKEGRGR